MTEKKQRSAEDRGWGLEVGGRRIECGGWMSEDGHRDNNGGHQDNDSGHHSNDSLHRSNDGEHCLYDSGHWFNDGGHCLYGSLQWDNDGGHTPCFSLLFFACPKKSNKRKGTTLTNRKLLLVAQATATQPQNLRFALSVDTRPQATDAS